MSMSPAKTSAARRGRVSTFYSYKGGVGRTFLLANVAWLLARWGRRVLCIDFDLEAPGIKQYLSAAPPPAAGGALDLLEAAGRGEDPNMDPWLEKLPGPWRTSGCLHLLGAGNTNDSGFIGRVQSLRIEELSKGGLNTRLEALRARWVEQYDHILIDSRTGITDIGGICAAQLPDMLVLVFNATHQSLEGAVRVERMARQRRASLPLDRGTFRVLPVPSRIIVGSEIDHEAKWDRRFQDEMGRLVRPWLPETVNMAAFLSQVRVPWRARWSFGEDLPVIEERLDDKDAISWSIANVAALVDTHLNGAAAITDSEALEGSLLPASRGRLLSLLAGEAGLGAPIERAMASRDDSERLWRQGRYNEAHRSAEAAHFEFTQVLGAEHPETLATHQNFATILSAQGDFATARTIYERVLEAQTKVLGPEHRATLNTLQNLASTLYAMGSVSAARAALELVLEARTRILGPEHLDTLNSLQNLAGALHDQRNFPAARASYEQAVDARTRILGPEHPDTLNAVQNLAATLIEQGDLPAGRETLERVLEAQSRILGTEHPNTLTTHQNYALALAGQGDNSAARAALEQVLEARTRILGPEHPSTRLTTFNLVLTLLQVEPLAAGPHLKVLAHLRARDPSHLAVSDQQILSQLPALEAHFAELSHPKG
jgi:tetratricopeptide (TPR) repeat protein